MASMYRKRNNILIPVGGLFTSDELKAYEERILDNRECTELEASKFFTDFPKFLSVGGYAELAREVVLNKGDTNKVYRVDFFRRKFGNKFWDVVELKSPKSKIVVRNGTHWKFSSVVEKAIHQSQDYYDILEKDIVRENLLKQKNILAYRPRILIVAGRRKPEEINEVELRRLESRFNNIEIKSFENLFMFATENYQSGLFVVPVFYTESGIIEEINSEIKKLGEHYFNRATGPLANEISKAIFAVQYLDDKAKSQVSFGNLKEATISAWAELCRCYYWVSEDYEDELGERIKNAKTKHELQKLIKEMR